MESLEKHNGSFQENTRKNFSEDDFLETVELPESPSPEWLREHTEIVGERKVFRGTRMRLIPVRRMRVLKNRSVATWQEKEYNDFILHEPVYEEGVSD